MTTRPYYGAQQTVGHAGPHPDPMAEHPATRLRAALAACHWSVRHVAPLIQWDERTIRHWLSGRYEPPPDVLAWIEDLGACHAQRPPPIRQRNGTSLPKQEPQS